MSIETRTWILDGFLGNSKRLETLRQRVEDEIGPAEIWKYQTAGVTPIDRLARVFRDILAWETAPVNIIAYSMGGLVTRAALAGRPMPNLKRVVFLHVPHHGTEMARLAPLPATRQMRPGSALLKRLALQPWNVETLNVWCPGDLIVVPGSRARWESASEEAVCQVPAHIWPIYSKQWHAKIVQFLSASSDD
jgi:pimeloyl-ACP methyl ester carboxylesterase